jgi:hypothetical protein
MAESELSGGELSVSHFNKPEKGFSNLLKAGENYAK